jgi:hypothetical protein
MRSLPLTDGNGKVVVVLILRIECGGDGGIVGEPDGAAAKGELVTPVVISRAAFATCVAQWRRRSSTLRFY